MRAGMTVLERRLAVLEEYLKTHGTFETVSVGTFLAFGEGWVHFGVEFIWRLGWVGWGIWVDSGSWWSRISVPFLEWLVFYCCARSL